MNGNGSCQGGFFRLFSRVLVVSNPPKLTLFLQLFFSRGQNLRVLRFPAEMWRWSLGSGQEKKPLPLRRPHGWTLSE